MKKIGKVLNEIFIEGLSGMALGLFATLIIGTIIKQIGTLIPGDIGTYLVIFGNAAATITGAGIGVGVAQKLKASPLVTVSAAACGIAAAFAGNMLTTLAAAKEASEAFSFSIALGKPGEPLGAFVAAIVAVYMGRLVSGKTKLDILVTPFCCILSGAAVGFLVGPQISAFMNWLGSIVEWGTVNAPFTMGIVVSVVMGIILTLPISSAAIGISLGMTGISAGAATAGCCANMIGFAVASFRENKVNGLVAQGLGTSMLQVPNIVKKPIIWLPAIIASAVTGPLSTLVFGMENNATGSGMGTSGLVGQINTFTVMTANGESPVIVLIKIALLHFIIPGVIAFLVSELMRKMKWIKAGDMKLDV